MKRMNIEAAAIDPYIAELGRDGWIFVAEVEADGEYVELACDALPTVAAMVAGKHPYVSLGKLLDEVDDAIDSAAFARGFDREDLQADCLIQCGWDIAKTVVDEAKRLAK